MSGSTGAVADARRLREFGIWAGGLFIEARGAGSVGEKIKLDFLVQEGQIWVEGVVRHVHPDRGVGLKFTAVRIEHRPNLICLLNRLRRLS